MDSFLSAGARGTQTHLFIDFILVRIFNSPCKLLGGRLTLGTLAIFFCSYRYLTTVSKHQSRRQGGKTGDMCHRLTSVRLSDRQTEDHLKYNKEFKGDLSSFFY